MNKKITKEVHYNINSKSKSDTDWMLDDVQIKSIEDARDRLAVIKKAYKDIGFSAISLKITRVTRIEEDVE